MKDDLWSIDLFDHEKLRWRLVKADSPGPEGRYAHAAEVVCNNLVIYGGCKIKQPGNETEILGDMWMLNTLTNQWVRVELPQSFDPFRLYPRMAAAKNQLFIYGGKLCATQPAQKDSSKILKITFV